MNPCSFGTNLCNCVTLIQNNQQSENTWALELLASNNDKSLWATSSVVQATIVRLNAPDIHEYVQTQDCHAQLDVDEDDMHAPLFMLTLDLSQWTLVLASELSTTGSGLEQLRVAHAQLADILEIATHNTTLLDVALKNMNPHEIPK